MFYFFQLLSEGKSFFGTLYQKSFIHGWKRVLTTFSIAFRVEKKLPKTAELLNFDSIVHKTYIRSQIFESLWPSLHKPKTYMLKVSFKFINAYFDFWRYSPFILIQCNVELSGKWSRKGKMLEEKDALGICIRTLWKYQWWHRIPLSEEKMYFLRKGFLYRDGLWHDYR